MRPRSHLAGLPTNLTGRPEIRLLTMSLFVASVVQVLLDHGNRVVDLKSHLTAHAERVDARILPTSALDFLVQTDLVDFVLVDRRISYEIQAAST